MASSKLPYPSFLRKMNSLGRFGSKPGLARIEKLLAALDHPEQKYKCILVAGTNGKGSTTAFLASALRAGAPAPAPPAGRRRPETRRLARVGSYYSPHLFSFCERIQVNGKNISKPALLSAARPVLRLLPAMKNDPPTFFEVATATALLYFARARVDYAVLEVGLGGRLDATNAVEPSLSIITSIGLEHTQWLGQTTAAIAREKCGILRHGVPVVSGAREKAARREIKKTARRLRAPITEVLTPYPYPLRATGAFQPYNASLAACAAWHLGVPKPIIQKSISRAAIPGRWQTISRSPRTVIDCAHNPPAAQAIEKDLSRDFNLKVSSPRVLLFAAMADKDYAPMLRALSPHFDDLVLCRPPFARAAQLADLEKAAAKFKPTPHIHAAPKPSAALRLAKKLSGRAGRILIAGSIYLLASLYGEKEFKLAS